MWITDPCYVNRESADLKIFIASYWFTLSARYSLFLFVHDFTTIIYISYDSNRYRRKPKSLTLATRCMSKKQSSPQNNYLWAIFFCIKFEYCYSRIYHCTWDLSKVSGFKWRLTVWICMVENEILGEQKENVDYSLREGLTWQHIHMGLCLAWMNWGAMILLYFL